MFVPEHLSYLYSFDMLEEETVLILHMKDKFLLVIEFPCLGDKFSVELSSM